jgi:hypothetical protein
MAQATSAAHQTVGLGTPRANLRLARGGARRRTTETPPRSRAPAPYHRNSASLEAVQSPAAPAPTSDQSIK